MFSFHATKVFNTIEGGAVTYKDKNLNKVLSDLEKFRITGLEAVESIGGNAKLNEFQAAMGICNLRHIEGEIAKRKVIVGTGTNIIQGVNIGTSTIISSGFCSY